MARFSALVSDSSDDELGQDAPHDAHEPGPSNMLVGRGSPTDSDRIEVDEDDEEEDTEEEEEEGDEMDEDERAVSPLRSSRKTRNHALVEDSDGEIQYEHSRPRSHSPTSSESDFDEPHHMDNSVAPWAQRVGMDAQKMHVMQTSLFRMPEEVAALQEMNKPTRPRFRLSPSVARKHSRESVGEARLDSQEVGTFCATGCRLAYKHFREPRSVMTSTLPFTVLRGNMHESRFPLRQWPETKVLWLTPV